MVVLDTIIRTMRGWDVTTFGHDNFDEMGAVLFTIRNGLLGTDIGCPYAEKLILMKEGQVLPMHFHSMKTEDIINRGGTMLKTARCLEFKTKEGLINRAFYQVLTTSSRGGFYEQFMGVNASLNAAILAVEMLALADEALAARLAAYKENLKKKIDAGADYIICRFHWSDHGFGCRRKSFGRRCSCSNRSNCFC